VLDRLRLVWEWRLEEAQAHASSKEELAAFSWWFSVPYFDGAWLLRNAQLVLETTNRLDPEFLIYEKLASLTPDHPEEVLDLLERLVQSSAEPWSVHAHRGEIRSILSGGLSSGNPQAVRKATNLAHALGSRGHLEFRDLVAAPSELPEGSTDS
jgi:hypothetical protein